MLPVAVFFVNLLQLGGAIPLAATIEVDAAEQAAPISRNLFGKFTEHLGRNVYLGMWAQVVPNPEFAPSSTWPEPERLVRQVNRYFEEFELSGPVPKGIAAYWSATGSITGEIGDSGTEYVQRLSGGAEGGRLVTGIYPPFHRVSKLLLRLKARAQVSTSLSVSVLSLKREMVARTEVELTSSMTEVKGQLAIGKDGSLPKGEPFLLSIELEPAAEVELVRLLVFPEDHVRGWEPEVVALMKGARLPMLRFPGGNFASGYHWEDGIGPLEARPVLPNPAWKGVMEWNHVGTDEWLTLCELTGAEPLICLNAGNGTAEEARRWVEYCNGSRNTPMGSLRAKNGHPTPYKVRYWEIGNELYGDWQIGHTDAAGYAVRYDEYARAVKSADPDVLIIANGRDADWNKVLVESAETAVRSISVHSLPGGGIPTEADPQLVFREFMAHAFDYEDFLIRVAQPMEEAGLEPKLAVTELQVFTNRPNLPNNATLTEALWTAGVIHSCIRSGIVELLTHSAMLNHGGGLRKVRGVVFSNPVWWTTHLYGSAEGKIPTGLRVACPTFSTEGEWLTETSDVPYLDAMGLLSADMASLTLFVVNKHDRESIPAEIVLKGFIAAREVEVKFLTGDSFMARNEWDAIAVELAEKEVNLRDNRLNYLLPPLSLSRFTFQSEAR